MPLWGRVGVLREPAPPSGGPDPRPRRAEEGVRRAPAEHFLTNVLFFQTLWLIYLSEHSGREEKYHFMSPGPNQKQ